LIFDDFTNICREKSRFNSNLKGITGTLREVVRTFLKISCSVLLRMGNLSDKSCKNIKKHSLGSKIIFENRVVYEIMWENFVQPGRLKMTIKYGACAVFVG